MTTEQEDSRKTTVTDRRERPPVNDNPLEQYQHKGRVYIYNPVESEDTRWISADETDCVPRRRHR